MVAARTVPLQAISMQGQWCGIRVYDPWAFCTNHYDITQNLNWQDVSSLCPDPTQDCELDVYAQLLGDDGKVKINKNHGAFFPVSSGGSIMMNDLATGCSGEGIKGLPLACQTIHHKMAVFTACNY